MKNLSQKLQGIYNNISDFTQRRNVESQHEFKFSAAYSFRGNNILCS
jgi:hypothetical protein